MSYSKIFELVRTEQTIIWAGSGLSKYAGYPLGKELSEIIFDSLSMQDQGEIEKTLSLAELSEQFVRLKHGRRNELTSILRKVFQKKPNSIKYHQLLANIPHIKTFITTNYDNLFELAFGNSAIKIVMESDVAKIKSQQEIFKIHGDLDLEESIIITKSDYAKFFLNDVSTNLYWSVIAERISNKSVLFIGYDLEDDNVTNLFDKVWLTLKENKKEAFLIAPALKKHKIQYLAQKGIIYLDSKGETFIEKLYQNIKDNIVADFNRGFVTVETLKTFFLKNNLVFDLKSFQQDLRLDNIREINGKLNPSISLKLINDELLKQKFSRFINGEEFGQLEFDGKTLADFKFSANNINLLDAEIDKYKVTLMSSPAKAGLVDVEFTDGFEVSAIEYKLFASSKKIQIDASYKGLSFEITVLHDGEGNSNNMINFKVSTSENYEQTLDAINVCQFLERFTRGMEGNIYTQENHKPLKFGGPPNIEYNSVIKDHLEFYEVMRKVEKAYEIKFRNISQPNTEIFNLGILALKALNNQENLVTWEGQLEFDLNKGGTPLELLLKVHNEGALIQAQSVEPEIIELYGQEISLGHKNIIYSDLQIVNLEQISNNQETKVKIASKNKTAKIIYKKESLMAN